MNTATEPTNQVRLSPVESRDRILVLARSPTSLSIIQRHLSPQSPEDRWALDWMLDLPSLETSLGLDRRAVVVIEVDPQHWEPAVVALTSWSRQRILSGQRILVLDRELDPRQRAGLAWAGAAAVLPPAGSGPRLLGYVRRHFHSLPPNQSTIESNVWRNLPWPRHNPTRSC